VVDHQDIQEVQSVAVVEYLHQVLMELQVEVLLWFHLQLQEEVLKV
jgi:hypothetical protein